MIRDLLELEHKPITDVLQVVKLQKPEGYESESELDQKTFVVNTQMTPMGRPVNVRPQVRWKSITNSQPPPSAETNLAVKSEAAVPQ